MLENAFHGLRLVVIGGTPGNLLAE
jgi:hypothetical protein